MDALRIGLIGCGRHGAGILLGVLQRIPSVQVAALADIDPQALDTTARLAPGAARFDNATDLLEKTPLDAVVIATANTSHVEIALQAFARGLHVYLEKPLGVTTAETHPLLDAWRASGRVGMIGFNYRRNPFFQQIAGEIAAGKIGRPLAVQTTFCNSSQRPIPQWKYRLDTGGGVCLDLGSHHVDLVMHLLRARVMQVSAVYSSVRSEADSVSLVMQLDNGASVQSFFSFHALRQDRIEVFGSQGALAVDRYQSLTVQHYPAEVEYSWPKRITGRLAALLRAPELLRRLRYPTLEPSYAAALRVFTAAARGEIPHPSPDLLDGYRVLQIIEAAHTAARSGQIIPVPPNAP